MNAAHGKWQSNEPKEYIDYQVRSFAQQTDGTSEPAPDEEANLFCIFGKLQDGSWEWIADVPTRDFGQDRIIWMPLAAKQAGATF
jgi:hypothetical protein